MADIRLLATDLDGTLIGAAQEFHLYTDFRAKMHDLRVNGDCVWAVCTSRDLGSFHHVFSSMRMMGLEPDFIIAKHAYIFGGSRRGTWRHLFWNLRIAYIQWANQLNVRKAIDQWHKSILRTFPGVKTIRKKKDRLWLRFSSEDFVTVAAKMLAKESKRFKHLRVFRYRMEVDLRAVPFTKGLALTELARHMEVDRQNILAIGNGHNDASMLDGSVATMVGCPKNSEAEVVETVHKAGGHISNEQCLSGVMDIVDAFTSGNVRSDLPDWWQDPATFDNGDKPIRPRHSSSKPLLPKIALFCVVAYVALLVFAKFNVIPFSGVIRKPYDMGLRVVMKIVRVLDS